VFRHSAILIVQEKHKTSFYEHGFRSAGMYMCMCMYMCVYGLSEHRVLSGCLKSVPIDSYIKWQVEIIICFFVFPGYTVDIQASDPLIP